MIENFLNDIIHGECIETLKRLPDGKIDLILTDLPYGTTSNKWDVIIPFEPMWEQYWRVLKPTGIIALNASQPFTSLLVTSQIDYFKHEWIWIKNRGSNFANTVREPMKEHESVLIFSKGKWTYNKQMQERTGSGGDRVKYDVAFRTKSENYQKIEDKEPHKLPEMRVPSSWQKFNTEVGLHPTQKPVDLARYMIRTYSNENEIVLDTCIGSGTTAIAALRENRQFIGIEKEQKYVDVALERVLKEIEGERKIA
jgi:site-specific DNA-methyltransferase (adenine-specific)